MWELGVKRRGARVGGLEAPARHSGGRLERLKEEKEVGFVCCSCFTMGEMGRRGWKGEKVNSWRSEERGEGQTEWNRVQVGRE
jgi:hypothetical protein